MKKVLIITYYWPPCGGSPVRRWLKFLKYFIEEGWETTIYTCSNGDYPFYDYTLEKEIPDGVKVIKKEIWEPYSFYKRFLGLKKESKIQTGFLSESSKSKFKENFAIWLRGNLFIPDARKFWIKPSIRFLRNYIKNHSFDLIISNGPPHTVHMIAEGLKKRLNIPWIADFRDPWTNIDFYHKLKLTKWGDKKHKRLEQKVINNADLITTVSWNWGEGFKKLGAKNVEVVTNAFDPEDFAHVNYKSEKQFTITHIGSLNADRNPVSFWEVLSELIHDERKIKDNLAIKFYGPTDIEVINTAKKMGLDKYLEIIPHVEHNVITEVLVNSPVLFLPLNNTPNVMGIIPGKLFEYIASKRPILAIGPKKGDTARILKETGAGKIFDFTDKEGLKSEILSLFEKFDKGELTEVKSSSDIYSRKSQAKAMLEFVDNLIK